MVNYISWLNVFFKIRSISFLYLCKSYSYNLSQSSSHLINQNAMYIGGPRIDLSSTNIRNIVSKKAKPKDLISENVMQYISTNELYQ